MSERPTKNAPKPPAAVSGELGAVARQIMAVQVDIDFGHIRTREDLQAASASLLKAMERLSEAKFELWRALSPAMPKAAAVAELPVAYDPIPPAREPQTVTQTPGGAA